MAKKIKVKLILELRANQMSQREISKTRKMSQHSVGDVFKLSDELGLSFEDIKDKSDEEVYWIFYPDKHSSETLFKQPDYKYIHAELKKTGVNLKLLWEEYKDSCNKGISIAMGYTKFCEGYSDYVTQNSLTSHLTHKPGIVCEVDWSGSTMAITNKDTGEVITVYLFVATLPYSQYTYVEPCLDMKQDTWMKCNVNMFEYFGGSTVRIVCDNLKVGVIKHPKEGDIVLNEKYEDFGNHYFTAIMPAGVKKPKHKASVEGSVGKIATAIIAKLRNNRYYTLEELKAGVSKALTQFNDGAFQKREGSRTEVFNEVEKSHLRTLPTVPYEVAEWVYGHSVNLDFHIAYKTNRYSAPYKYVGKKVDLKITESLLEIYAKGERIATHKLFPSYMKYKWSTLQEHMPDQFQRTEWDDERIKKWAYSIGNCTGEVIERIFKSVRIKEQGYNATLSVLKLSKTYSDKRLEIACEIALSRIRVPRYNHLKSILASNEDHLYLAKKSEDEIKALNQSAQGYVRGSRYYGGGEN
ncbi:MAG: IS21 family transposase [Methanosarcinaceae archaeon]|nr:IS21 family transposase [Methanosarcinaceae archaeon]